MTGTGTGKFKWLLPLLLLALTLSSPASASHYRFGHITWEPRPDISPTTVDFRFVLSARRSFFGSPEIGDVVTRASDRFRFGDGSSTQSLEFRVIASNPEEDWIMAEAREPGSGLESVIRKTYDTPVDADGQPWKAHYSSLARLGNIHNRGSRFRLETSVDLSKGFRSPVSNQAPVLSCERGAVCGFSVPAVDPDGNGLRWRSAVGSESNVPRLPAEDFHIDPDTGLISWPTTDDDPLGFYSVPLQIEDLDEDGNVRSSVPIEFLINLQDFAENNPPVFDVPPTPPSDETLTIPPERELSFVVQATDPDAQDSVVLNHTGLPGGAEFETEPGNPAQGTFRWTPEESQLGEHLLTFTAIDDRNNASLPHPVRLEVVEPGIESGRLVDYGVINMNPRQERPGTRSAPDFTSVP